MKKVLSVVLALLLLLSVVCVIPVTAADATSTAEGWNGTTATKPEGEGTKESPYLVASAANLNWIRTQMPAADSGIYTPTGSQYAQKEELGLIYGKFEGVYFLQTADIDLNGKSMSSIGYYSTSNVWSTAEGNDRRFSAFAGIYDGNGYCIKNGTITAANAGHGLNTNWACGLFGFIYGATIRNLTLDETLSVRGNGINGALVGIALAYSNAPAGSKDAEKVNVIENCHVNADLTVTNPTNQTTAARNLATGGLIGYAFRATIKNCTVTSNISAPGNYMAIGGIAGLAGASTTIDHCAFTGTITWDCDALKNSVANSIFGGIVATAAPSGDVATGTGATQGFLKITNCYNSGSFAVKGTANNAYAVAWGGILGCTSSLNGTLLTADEPYPYLVENCYNLWNATAEKMNLDTSKNNVQIAGIHASSWLNGNSASFDLSPLFLKDCTSVEIGNRGNGNDVTGNEYNYHKSNRSRYKDENGNQYYSAAVIGNSVPNVDRTEAAIRVKTNEIDAVIERAKAEAKQSLVLKFDQQSLTTPNSYRLVFGINDIGRYESYAFEITADVDGNTVTIPAQSGTTVYNSVISVENGEEKTVAAEEYGAFFFASLMLKNLQNGTYTIQSYAIEKDTGAKINGTSFTLTYADGAVTIAVHS